MNRTRALPPWFCLACLFFCLLGARGVYAMAQDRQKGDRIPPGTQSQKDESTFRVNVRLVNVFTTVTDSRGAPVADLTKDDFQLLEDGVPQTIKVFEKESAIPLSIALAIDTSPSTMRDFKLETTSARRFVHSILRSEDRLSIFEVTEHVDQITRFTSDIRTIEHGIDSLRTGPGTSIYDAIFLCSESLMDREGRKVLVLITDGGDTTSKADYNGALRRAQQAEAIVYSIIVVPVEADAGRNLGGEHALIQISKDTGGKYYYAEGQQQLDEAFRKISDELRTQYLLAFYPSRKLSDSPFRRIQVELNKKDPEGRAYQVRHRAGYYTAPAR
ncbi:MAG TPA: VWA domain-containing protein [Candidatus Polarisedimenticolia bacterium]|nr:VWA domain-containing protein [Candidatus Polarisedimenticolia bacterium]